jgi:hypothetical protein
MSSGPIGGGGNVGGTGFVPTNVELPPDAEVDEVDSGAAESARRRGELPGDGYGPNGPVGFAGPGSTTAGAEEYSVSSEAFGLAGVPDPYNANTTPGLERDLRNDPGFPGAVSSMQQALQSGEAQHRQQFFERLGALKYDDVMATLAVVMKEATKQSQADQRYYLKQIANLNKIAEKFAEEQAKFNDASKNLSGCEKGSDEPQDCRTSINTTVAVPDPHGSVDENGNVVGTATNLSLSGLSRDDLNAAQRQFDAKREDIKALQHEFKSKLQAAQQAGNGTMQILVTVVKEHAKSLAIGSNNLK